MARWHGIIEDHPTLAAVISYIRSILPPLNFITLHYAYFVIVCLLASVIFWGSSDPTASISYTDSLFLVVSAMTEAGLNTVNLSQITTWQQTLLFLLIVFGSSIWVSIWTVVARKHVFEKRFEDIVRVERMRGMNRAGSTLSLPTLQRLKSFRKPQASRSPLSPMVPAAVAAVSSEKQDACPRSPPFRPNMGEHSEGLHSPLTAGDAILLNSAAPLASTTDKEEQTIPGSAGHIVFVEGVRPDLAANAAAVSSAAQYHGPETRHPVRRAVAPTSRETSEAGEKGELNMAYFLKHRTAGRNGQFHDLTAGERDRLGGYEYRALKVLSVLVPLYFVLWQLLGCIALGAWIHNNQPGPPLANGITPWWLGIFNGVSAFNNSGMSLLDANMIPFQQSTFVLITMGLLVLAGNTAYPIFLRLIIWTLLHLLTLATEDEDFSDLKNTFKFILKYPRRVYTNLFPSRPTWWLLFMLVLLNSVDWVAFELLNLGNPAIESIPSGSRVLDGLFQALAVRSGGFYVVAIPSTYIGLQVLYVIMMYISVYPVVITMRHSNVYEERSLGIYSGDTSDDEQTDTEEPRPNTIAHRLGHSDTAATFGRALHHTFTWHGVGAHPAHSHGTESRISFISHQIQGQLAHDTWWLVLAILVIVTIETSNFLANPVTFSVFNVIFEVVSAYGCVGISVGLPNESYSFSGSWHVSSKLVLCAVMLRGRHRGLPVALDRAVRLPGERLHHEEEEDHRIRRSMTNRRVSMDD
ncbi:Cation transport domain containing protein [Naviculisporaceae sp. PSN 640]